MSKGHFERLFRKRFLFFFICIGLTPAVWTHEGKLHSQIKELLPYAYYLVDTGRHEDAQSLLDDAEFLKNNSFSRANKPLLSFGHIMYPVWLKISIDKKLAQSVKNELEKKQRWYLQIENPLLTYIDAYVLNGKSQTLIYQGGNLRAHEHSRFHPVPEIEISDYIKEGNDIYVKVESEWGMVLSAKLLNDDLLHIAQNKQRILTGILLGILLAIMAYNTFLLFTLKEPVYLNYVLYLVFGCMHLAYNGGYLRLLLPGYPGLLNFMYHVSISLWIIFYINFTRLFLNMSVRTPRINNIYWGLIFFWIIITFLRGIIPTPIQTNILEITGGLSIFFTLAIAVRELLRGFKPTRFFLTGFAFYSIVMIVMLLGTLNIYFITTDLYLFKNLASIGHAGEAIFLAFALAERYSSLKEQNQRLEIVEREVEIAGEVQRHLLPRKHAFSSNITIASRYLVSSMVGGDFYDFQEHKNGKYSVLVADVAGHGFSAGLIASMVKGAYHEALINNISPRYIVNSLNSVLMRGNENNFVTMVYMLIDCKKMTVEFSCCGHPPIIVYNRNNKTMKEFNANGAPLGIHQNPEFGTARFKVIPNDRIILYTDGLIEERNPLNEDFGLKRLETALGSGSHLEAEGFADYLIRTLQAWKDWVKQEDDITFIIIDFDVSGKLAKTTVKKQKKKI